MAGSMIDLHNKYFFYRMLSPIGMTPASGSIERHIEPIAPMSPVSSSDSGSDSGSDSDSSSDDSQEETQAVTRGPKSPPMPAPVEPIAPMSPNLPDAEEEKRQTRWNLASYFSNNNSTAHQSPPQNPTSNATNKSDQRDLRNRHDDSDGSDSAKDVDRVLDEVKICSPLSGLSESDGSTKKKALRKRKRIISKSSVPDDSDSDVSPERTKVQKPVNRVSPRTKSPGSSDSEAENRKQLKSSPIKSKVLDKSVKPKSNRGRPRKVKPSNSGSDQEIKKKRGRPPGSSKNRRPSASGSDAETPKRRGRPPLKAKRPRSPSSSDDDKPQSCTFEKPMIPARRRTVSKRASSSGSDSDLRSSSLVKSCDKDSVKKKLLLKHRPPTEDKLKCPNSDNDERNQTRKKLQNYLFEKNDRIEATNQKRPSQSPHKKETKVPVKRKGRSNSHKSAAVVPTSSDSDSSATNDSSSLNSRPKKHSSRPSRSSSSEVDVKREHSSDSEPPSGKIEGPAKVSGDHKSIQDKKKNDTLRKLFFTPKRDSEGGKGGKGGAKGGKGGKGGKGKGGVNVIIMDGGDYERSSSPVEDETMPTNRTSATVPLLSPLPCDSRSAANISSVDTSRVKTEPMDSAECNSFRYPSLMVRIELNRIVSIPPPAPKGRKLADYRPVFDFASVASRVKKEPADTTNAPDTLQKQSDCEDRRTCNDSDSEFPRKHVKDEPLVDTKSKKRKRQNSCSSISSISTISSMSHSSRKKDHSKERSHHKSKRRKGDSELSTVTASASRDFEERLPPQRERPRTPPMPSPAGQQPIREYHSYFERTDDQSDEERLVSLVLFPAVQILEWILNSCNWLQRSK